MGGACASGGRRVVISLPTNAYGQGIMNVNECAVLALAYVNGHAHDPDVRYLAELLPCDDGGGIDG